MTRVDIKDAIKGMMIGGACGDALGYAVEFLDEDDIKDNYGSRGIREYDVDFDTGKAIISDDTQMTLFTATGLLSCLTRNKLRGKRMLPRHYVYASYINWYETQDYALVPNPVKYTKEKGVPIFSWLMNIRELYELRAPGNTCLRGLEYRMAHDPVNDYIHSPINAGHGCGGLMRIAPVAAMKTDNVEKLDYEAAQIAAITHSHSLGYIPAAMLNHILHQLIYEPNSQSLMEIIKEAQEVMYRLFGEDENIGQFMDLIDDAVVRSQNNLKDIDNIHALGQGWKAEETLPIAIYCALKYWDHFSEGIITAVNHEGDSDSTGAITGQILGALHGYREIDERWITSLQLREVIETIADDLYQGTNINDSEWLAKYADPKITR